MQLKKKQQDPPKDEIIYSITAKEYADLSADERAEWSPVKAKYEKIPLFCKISLIIGAICTILYVIICISEPFSDFFNRYVSTAFRFLFAKITNILPFSLAELIIILLPVIAFISIWYLLKFRCDTRRSSTVSIVCIFSILALFLSSFVLCFAAGYKGTSLDKKLDIKTESVSTDDLYKTSEYLVDKINELSVEISYGNDDFSLMPYDFKEMNEKLLEAYDVFCQDHNFISTFNSRLKPVLLSEAMSYAHITGIYSFFTGETNINVRFPDYTIPFTSAHEMAHQRGIAREDEANMIAFLVCIESEDPYIQYSAYLNVFEYVASALYRADSKKFQQIYNKLNTNTYREQKAYNAFFEKYDNSVASQVSGAVNDTYLKAQGTAGKKSYGMVVDLTVAYLKTKNYIK